MLESITLSINGQNFSLAIEPFESLNYVIRDRLGLIGTKKGCETGGCGSCTVIADGKAIYSCMTYALQCQDRKIRTIEGLLKGSELDPIQIGFMDYGGLQCGFCTTGFIMSSRALLDKIPSPSDAQIRDALVGNLCRCTGYKKIFDSVKAAAEVINKK
ncbi:MAG: (2Fe-2S)-binding protein [Thaumarchaeota archaeon]|nr:(2Fe-2S)-binding protein [Nitrososphaerota archaeon]